MHRFLRPHLLLVAGCVALLAGGCAALVSPIAPGLELEADGHYAEAAEVYLGLLEEDAELEEARRRLRDVGPSAIAIHMDRARKAAADGDYASAMRHIQSLERLRREAGTAGVGLEVPEELATLREETTRNAVAHFVQRAERAEAEGAWVGAQESYLRALHYAPREQQAELNDALYDLQVRWAHALLQEGRFGEAYDRAQHVLEMVEEDDARRASAMGLYRAAREAAATHVALLPVGASEAVAGRLPERLRIAVHEVLERRFWEEAPPFVESVSRDALRRELRRLRYDQHRIRHRQAMELGRVLQADLVVLTEIVDFRREETGLQEEQRRAAFLGPGTPDTLYTVQHATLEMEAEIAFRTVDPEFGLVRNEGSVHAFVTHPIERGVFMGSTHQLALPEEEEALFDLEALAQQERAVSNELIELLVEALLERLHHQALAQQ